MKNILIIGVNGFTGRRILNDLSVNPIYHVTGCSLRDDICPGKDYRFVRTDIRDENEVRIHPTSAGRGSRNAEQH